MNAIRRNIGLVKAKLRNAEPRVMEQVILSFARSLLIYFAAPLYAAGVWDEKKIESIERDIYKEVYMLPNSLNRAAIVNLVRRNRPAVDVVVEQVKQVTRVNSR